MIVLPFAVTFELVDIGEGGRHDDNNSDEASEAEEGHNDVGGGDFHVSGLTKVIVIY